MTPEYRAASRLVDKLTRKLLVRPHAARSRTARPGSKRRASELEQLASAWPWRSNIIGLAVCEKRTRGKRLAGQIVATFFVQRKLAKRRLDRDERIPAALELPDGTRVHTDIVVASGVPLAESTLERPVRPGCSVGHFQGLVGTLGPIVRKRGTRTPLIMSCSHVIARAGLAKRADAIEQPPDGDGAVGPHVIGTLTDDFTRLNPFAVNTMDIALAAVKPGIEVSNEIVGSAGSTGVSTLRPEDLNNVGSISLTRFGARTGIQAGVLEGMHASVPLEIPALGPGTVVFGRVGLYRTHSLSGDSGAPIVRMDRGELFGIHIGRIGDFGVFSPIQAVLEEFGIELFDEA
jgi:hypothetical protein